MRLESVRVRYHSSNDAGRAAAICYALIAAKADQKLYA